MNKELWFLGLLQLFKQSLPKRKFPEIQPLDLNLLKTRGWRVWTEILKTKYHAALFLIYPDFNTEETQIWF